MAGSFRNHPQRLRFKGQRRWGGDAGVRLTVTQCSPDSGGLWVAEWSTWRKAASPFHLPPSLLPSPSEGTQSRHCVGNDCALKMEPGRRGAGKCAAPVQTAHSIPSSALSFLFFAAKSHQIRFLGRVGGALPNEIPAESRNPPPPTTTTTLPLPPSFLS